MQHKDTFHLCVLCALARKKYCKPLNQASLDYAKSDRNSQIKSELVHIMKVHVCNQLRVYSPLVPRHSCLSFPLFPLWFKKTTVHCQSFSATAIIKAPALQAVQPVHPFSYSEQPGIPDDPDTRTRAQRHCSFLRYQKQLQNFSF